MLRCCAPRGMSSMCHGAVRSQLPAQRTRMAVATHHASCLANERLSRNAKGQSCCNSRAGSRRQHPRAFESLFAARMIVDNELLTEALGELRIQDARDRVRQTARCVGREDADRSIRIASGFAAAHGLRRDGRGTQHGGDGKCEETRARPPTPPREVKKR